MNKKLFYLLFVLTLVLGFVVRLYKINNPIADWHSWRQADTSAVTRNYIKYGIDILHPRYDDFSDVSGKGLFNPQGYRFVEFPIFNLLHFSLYSLAHLVNFQTLEFWGRMTSILCALVSSVFLYKIVTFKVNQKAGLLAMLFYLFLPYNIYFTRVVLPDPLMVTFFLAALYFHARQKKLLTLLFAALAILVKPVALFFMLPIFLSNPFLFVFAGIPFLFWRMWSFNFPQGVPASLWLLNGNNIRFKPAFLQWIFGVRIGSLILGKWGIWPLLQGLLSSDGYFHLWTIGGLVYLFTFATGNVQHDYYQIPIIPIISVLLSVGCVRLWSYGETYLNRYLSRVVLISTVLLTFALSWYDIRGLYQINNYSIVLAGQAVDKLVPKNAVVVAPYGGDTAFLYQTNRPGFPFMYIPIKDMIDRYNATFYVSVNYDDDTKKIMDKYTVRVQTPQYVIVELIERDVSKPI